jgi:site-specific DNA-methyltransferase (adenine-specific)
MSLIDNMTETDLERVPTNEILKGDCIERLKNLPNNSIDMIFADPPYFMQTDGVLLRNNGTKFEGVDDDWDKFADYKEYDSFCENWLRECKRVLKKDGTMWVIGSFQNIYRLGYLMQNLGYWILNDIIWSKPNAPPNFKGTRFQNSHETLLWCSKDKKARYTFNYKTMKHENKGKQDNSVWNIGICIGQERLKDEGGKKVHSTQKPERLLYKIILSSTKPGDIVLDPFFGTGTTGAVAKRLGRKFIGIEREEKYIQEAKRRIEGIMLDNNDLYKLGLEKKPPRVSVEALISSGKLVLNEILYDKKGKEICKVLENGKVSDGLNELSIHDMPEKFVGRRMNGWEWFFVKREGKLKSINDFRYEVENE